MNVAVSPRQYSCGAYVRRGMGSLTLHHQAALQAERRQERPNGYGRGFAGGGSERLAVITEAVGSFVIDHVLHFWSVHHSPLKSSSS